MDGSEIRRSPPGISSNPVKSANNTLYIYIINKLVGGFNPSEKYWSNWKSSPNTGEHKKYLSCHHLVNNGDTLPFPQLVRFFRIQNSNSGSFGSDVLQESLLDRMDPMGLAILQSDRSKNPEGSRYLDPSHGAPGGFLIGRKFGLVLGCKKKTFKRFGGQIPSN